MAELLVLHQRRFPYVCVQYFFWVHIGALDIKRNCMYG